MYNCVILFTLVAFTLAASPYVDKGYPYLDGKFDTQWFFVKPSTNKSPLHSVVCQPTTPGTYGVYFFIGGLDGLVDAEAYTNYLGRLAEHGFISIGVDTLFPLIDGKRTRMEVGDFADKFEKQLRWLEQNMTSLLTPGVVADWSYVAIGSHSDGADGALLLVERNHTIAQSIVFYEPFSFKFTNATTFKMPALIIGTALSKEHAPKMPPCIIDGFGFDHFYDMWGGGSKFLINVKNFGHCDVLDFDIREVCKVTKICLSGNSTSIDRYHDFAVGVTSAYLVSTLYGYTDDLKYVMDASNIPIELEYIKHNLVPSDNF